jgi:hypothetical protein
VTLPVTPINDPPVAHAGADQVVEEGTRVALDGSGSADVDGDRLTFAWTQIAGTTVTLDLADPAQPVFTAPDVPRDGETLTFQLVVNDGQVASEPAT